MLAAKHLDPVIGVDIHLIQPPGPVPPVPIPHPFVGFLMDPADYVPIVGSTVLINNLHRAQAGTAGKCVPPHIPIGGVFVPPPPGNECEMYMGSATVECDGDALSYMALPALSCQSVGMPSIPRTSPKKKTIPKCLMLPTSQVLPIPAGPPVLVGGPPTISIMGMAMKAGTAALGKLAKAFKKLQKGSKRAKAISKRMHEAAKKNMDKLGVPPSARNRVHRAICSVTGHPVDIATGKVFTDAVDFQLPGPLPLVWERVWFSTSTYNGPLGRGWHHNYDLGLVDEGDAIAVRLADGRPVAFPPINEGESVFDRTERLTLLRSHLGYALRQIDGTTFHFGIVTFDSPVQKLLAVTDRAGFRIEFSWDKDGHLSQIRDSGGRSLTVHSDRHGRIQQILAPHPDQPTQSFPIIRYEYDHSGLLLAVRDPLDHPTTFEYSPNGLLTREINRNGLSFCFAYDKDSPDAKCLHTWGDNGIYERWLTYDAELRRTIVTNSLGHATTHFANENGLVTRVIDPLGAVSQTEYSEFNQPLAATNPLGLATEWAWDARGNQIGEISPAGTPTAVEYNALDLLTKITLPSGAVWTWEYDQSGQLIARTDPTARQFRFHWHAGLLTEVIAPDGSSTRLAYHNSRLLSQLTEANGSTVNWSYDALGRTLETLSPAGSQRTTRDLAGRPIRVAEPDGNLRSLAWDPEGNLLHYGDVHRNIRLTYQGMNRLASRREAGRTVEFRYNTEENLVGVVNQNGLVYRFEYDENGQLTREYGFDQLRRIYTRDAAGRTVRLERSSGAALLYNYNPLDQITSIQYPDGSAETWNWNPNGQLVETANIHCTLRFERDPAGRILREWQNDFWVESSYDAVGRRSEVRSCFGSVQKIERDAVGDTTAFSWSDAATDPGKRLWEAHIHRDQLGFELERQLPGGIRSRWQRDQTGRPIHHQILRNEKPLRDVRYEWDPGDRLKKLVSPESGTVTFQFDAVGNLAAANFENGLSELRVPDAVGNLYKTADRTDRKYGPAGELLESRDKTGITRYEYDRDGNLVHKITPAGDWHYHWNHSGMLASVQRPDGSLITFQYDPLGRRIARSTNGKITRWIWDGNNPLHEWIQLPPEELAALQIAKPAAAPTPPPQLAALESHPPTGPPVGTPSETKTNDPPLEPQPLLPQPPQLITWLFDPDTLQPAAKIEGDRRYSIVTDHLGTPAAMLDEYGQSVWSAEISIYGELKNLQTAPGYSASSCPFRWLGQYADEDTGLYYNRFRYYDPSSGRYISQDPIGLAGGMELCAYVHDPLTWVDPFGLTPNGPCGGGGNAPNTKPKPYSNPRNRPKYAEGQVEKVWKNAKQANGKVYDPNTGAELTWDPTKPRTRQWDMGHKPGKKYADLHKDYMDGKITKEEFLREYRDPNNYWPEDWFENQSHNWE